VIETETTLGGVPYSLVSVSQQSETKTNTSVTGPAPRVQFVSLLIKVEPKVIETETELREFPKAELALESDTTKIA